MTAKPAGTANAKKPGKGSATPRKSPTPATTRQQKPCANEPVWPATTKQSKPKSSQCAVTSEREESERKKRILAEWREIRRPACFDSVKQWHIWLSLAVKCEPIPASFCTDCTPTYQAEMLLQRRCRHADVVFVSGEGVRADQQLQGRPRKAA